MVLKFLKRGGQLVLIPIATGLAVMILLALVYLLPTGGMKAHVKNTLDNFEKEGQYFYSLTGEAGSGHDNFIEALYLDQAIVGTEDADLLSCVLNGACELVVTRFHCKVGRRFDEETGLNLYSF